MFYYHDNSKFADTTVLYKTYKNVGVKRPSKIRKFVNASLR